MLGLELYSAHGNNMHIWLLTHSEELKKANGTGKIVKKALNDYCSVIVWQRTAPCQELLELPIQLYA